LGSTYAHGMAGQGNCSLRGNARATCRTLD
jgi:hypothetical protein